jgi:hypothetical protein
VAHGGAEVEPVLPGDDVVVLVLMQLDVDALGLVYIWHVRQVKVLRSPGTSPCPRGHGALERGGLYSWEHLTLEPHAPVWRRPHSVL